MSESIKIWFMDGSYKSFAYSRGETLEDLWYSVVQRLGLVNQAAECFFLWSSCQTLELLCYTDETVVDVVQAWPATYSKYHEREIGIVKETAYALKKIRHKDLPELRLTFRTTSILPLSQERNIKDPIAIYLFYIQAVFNVIESNYPCEPDVAAGLAGLQLQLTLGDYKPETHTPEYLGRFLKSYVPEHLKRKMASTKWKTRILEEHKRHAGKDRLILQLLYLQLVRQWPYYGSTFFKAEYIPVAQSFYKQPFEGEVRIGINMYGLHIIDPKRMIMNTYTYTDLKEWESDKNLFYFLTPKGEVKKHIYKTPQANLVNDLLWDVIGDLAQHVKKIDTIREKQGGSRILTQQAIETKYKNTVLSPFHEEGSVVLKGKEKEDETRQADKYEVA
jgi:hypothetical protein